MGAGCGANDCYWNWSVQKSYQEIGKVSSIIKVKFSRSHAFEEPDMNRSTIIFSATVGLLAGLALMATPVFSQSPTAEPTPNPTPDPAANPTAEPAATPTVAPTTRPDPATVTTNTVLYTCDAGKGFIANYRSDEKVEAAFGSKVIVLPEVTSASGARYSDGSVTLHTKGDGAFVEVGDKMLFENCVAIQEPIEAKW
jgi:membrane-bound inhibitor of C-type lysozyme